MSSPKDTKSSLPVVTKTEGAYYSITVTDPTRHCPFVPAHCCPSPPQQVVVVVVVVVLLLHARTSLSRSCRFTDKAIMTNHDVDSRLTKGRRR
jgi:hypothetical protein